MEISADGFVLRPWAAGDEEALVRHANNPNVACWLRDHFPQPYTRDDADDWIARMAAELASGGPPLNFAIVHEGEAIGSVGLERLPDMARRTAELGYWLSEQHWGKGFATEAAKQLALHAFAHFDFVRLEAGVIEGNTASCRVLEKAGFQLEAKLAKSVFRNGQVLDLLLYVRFS